LSTQFTVFMSFTTCKSTYKIILETESDLQSSRSEIDMKQKMFESEQSQRKQLEVQVNRLTNSRICDRMMKGSLDNLPRHSLETPIMSPELRREPTYNQTRYLYYK